MVTLYYGLCCNSNCTIVFGVCVDAADAFLRMQAAFLRMQAVFLRMQAVFSCEAVLLVDVMN